MTKFRVEPAGAHNATIRCNRLQCLLPAQFAGAIDADRVRGITLQIGGVLLSIKDVVGTDMDQSALLLFGNLCNLCYSLMVDPLYLLHITLGLVDSGVGCCIEDDVVMVVIEVVLNGVGIQQIQFGTVTETDLQPWIVRGNFANGSRQLPLHSNDQ